MSSIEETLFDRYKLLEKKRDELARQVKNEEELFAKNSDPFENKTYKYYLTEGTNVSERKERDLKNLLNKAESDKRIIDERCQREITNLETKAESDKKIIDEKLEKAIERIELNSQVTAKDYSDKAQDVIKNLGIPTSLTYRRKKEAIDSFDSDILNAKAEWNRVCDEQMQKRRANALEQRERENREERQREKAEWEEARLRRQDEVRAQEAKDEARRVKAGLEIPSSIRYTTGDVIARVEQLVEDEKPKKVVYQKLAFNRKKFQRMTLEEMENTDSKTVPDEVLDDWNDRIEFLERKAERNVK